MVKGNRVRLVDHDDVDECEVILGTVSSHSPMGYTRVEWDDAHRATQDHFSPRATAKSLRVVTGDDALPLHEWEESSRNANDWRCRHCDALQEDENYWERCRVRRV